MLKQNYDRAVRLCSRSIEEGFDLTPSHAAEEKLPFDAVYSLRRQMFSRSELVREALVQRPLRDMVRLEYSFQLWSL